MNNSFSAVVLEKIRQFCQNFNLSVRRNFLTENTFLKLTWIFIFIQTPVLSRNTNFCQKTTGRMSNCLFTSPEEYFEKKNLLKQVYTFHITQVWAKMFRGVVATAFYVSQRTYWTKTNFEPTIYLSTKSLFERKNSLCLSMVHFTCPG